MDKITMLTGIAIIVNAAAIVTVFAAIVTDIALTIVVVAFVDTAEIIPVVLIALLSSLPQ